MPCLSIPTRFHTKTNYALRKSSVLSNPQFQIASKLLIGLMCRTKSYERSNQVADVRQALEVSAELIRQWEGDRLPNCAYTPPAPASPATTREALVDRSFVSTEEWRRNRAARCTPAPPTRKTGPTVH